MAEYIVNTDDGNNVASVEYNISVEPVMRIELVTATFNKDKAERIVRCKDCKHLDCSYCKRLEYAVFIVGADGFCAWGEPES